MVQCISSNALSWRCALRWKTTHWEHLHTNKTIETFRCLQMFADVYRCLQMVTDVYRCLQMFYRCLQMFYRCLQMFYSCLQMFYRCLQMFYRCFTDVYRGSNRNKTEVNTKRTVIRQMLKNIQVLISTCVTTKLVIASKFHAFKGMKEGGETTERFCHFYSNVSLFFWV